MAVSLPDWAWLGDKSAEGLDVVHVDADRAYPALLSELGVKKADRDQYWLEVAYQCIKLDLQVSMRKFGFEVRIHDSDKNWAQAKFSAGRGAEVATKGREARDHYRQMRGFIPS